MVTGTLCVGTVGLAKEKGSLASPTLSCLGSPTVGADGLRASFFCLCGFDTVASLTNTMEFRVTGSDSPSEMA